METKSQESRVMKSPDFSRRDIPKDVLSWLHLGGNHELNRKGKMSSIRKKSGML